jgi:hypothetical protein
VFQGHATVQLQGSTYKGTSLQGSSDWDFFVRLNDNIVTATKAQRTAVHDGLHAQFAAAGISYRMQYGENRIRLFQGRDMQGGLPDCDVVLQRYEDDVRVPPNGKALASSHIAQQVGGRVCIVHCWLENIFHFPPCSRCTSLLTFISTFQCHTTKQLAVQDHWIAQQPYPPASVAFPTPHLLLLLTLLAAAAAAAAHNAVFQVVRYFKLLPTRYTNLPQPKSSLLEQAVMKLDTHMRCQQGLGKADMQGAAGFERLLTAAMQAVAGVGNTAGVQESLQQAGVNGEWRPVAQRVLNYRTAHGCWPQV